MKEKVKVYEKKSIIQQIKEGYKNANVQLIFEPEHLVYIDDNIYGYTNIEKASEYLHGKGIFLAAVVTAQTLFGNNYHVVLCDEATFELPKFVQEFLIQHEVGHAVNGDLEQVKTSIKSYELILKRALGFLPEMEIKADAFAVKINGIEDTKKAIKFLIHETNLPFNSKLELVRRYKKVCRYE